MNIGTLIPPNIPQHMLDRIARSFRRRRPLPTWLRHNWKTPDFSVVTRQQRRREGFASEFRDVTRVCGREATRKQRRVMSRISFKRHFGAGIRRPGVQGSYELFDSRGRYQGNTASKKNWRRGNNFRRSLARLADAARKGWTGVGAAYGRACAYACLTLIFGNQKTKVFEHLDRYFPHASGPVAEVLNAH